MTAEIIAKALGACWTGSGWMARWPAHDDREPSLSICGADEKSTWRQGLKDGHFPKPVKLCPKATVWRVGDIRAHFERPGR